MDISKNMNRKLEFTGDIYRQIMQRLSVIDSFNARDQLWTRLSESQGTAQLYNGNIAWMTTDLAKIGEEQAERTKGMQAMLYKYDQLNRITSGLSLTNY